MLFSCNYQEIILIAWFDSYFLALDKEMFLCLHFFCMIVSYLNNDIFSYHSEAQNILRNVYLQEPILNILLDTKMLCPIRFVYCHHTPDPQQSIRILICKCKYV